MNLITLVVVLLIIGVIMYVVNRAVPLDPPWPMIINAVVIIIVLLWVLQSLGVLGPVLRVR
jgi:hypothetical protein